MWPNIEGSAQICKWYDGFAKFCVLVQWCFRFSFYYYYYYGRCSFVCRKHKVQFLHFSCKYSRKSVYVIIRHFCV